MNLLKWSESNTSSRSYEVGSCRTRLIVTDWNNDNVGEVNEFWRRRCDIFINGIDNGANSTDQPERLGYWRRPKAVIQFYEKVLQKKEQLWQVLKWISSFGLFLYGVEISQEQCDTYNLPSTFFVMTDCLRGRLIREEIEKLLLVLDDFLLSCWRWVAKAGRAPCGLELEGAREAHWLVLSLFKGSFGAWVDASSMPLADDS